MIPESLRQVANELWNIIRHGNCYAWIGSGLSKPADYPEWPKAIDILCDKCEVPHLSVSEKNDPNKLMSKAEDCKKQKPEVYCLTLGEMYGLRKACTREAYTYLTELPFRGYITTNYDPLLAKAAERIGNIQIQSYPRLQMRTDSQKQVYYIHGFAQRNDEPNGENLVLATSEFEKAYKASILPSFLLQVLSFSPIVFIGCRLLEPSIQDTFKRVNDIHLQIISSDPDFPIPPRSILLLLETNENGNEVFTNFQIEKISFDKIDDNHVGIEYILEFLLKKHQQNEKEKSTFGGQFEKPPSRIIR